jgi:ribonuclease T
MEADDAVATTTDSTAERSPIARRFRGFLPVVVDVETAGFNPERDALLEIAAVMLAIDDRGEWGRARTIHAHVRPFPGANLDKAALEFTGIDPFHPFRMAVSERDALEAIFGPVRLALGTTGCSRAILVGHNASFDLSFMKAAVNRVGIKRSPFHSFSTLDTASLAALAYGQTVLARAVQAAGLEWDSTRAHSAVYDAEITADLFCRIVNCWDQSARSGS